MRFLCLILSFYNIINYNCIVGILDDYKTYLSSRSGFGKMTEFSNCCNALNVKQNRISPHFTKLLMDLKTRRSGDFVLEHVSVF